jgi:hypothetical protein
VSALADGISDKPINPDSREYERQKREGAEHLQENWVPAMLSMNHGGHAHYLRQRKLGVQTPNSVSQR